MNKNLSIFLIALSMLFLATQLLSPVNATAGVYSCTQYALKQCISNISYWYDSCGNIQAVNQNCNTSNQVCQNGSCVNPTGTSTYVPPTTNPNTSYIQNYRTNCYAGNIHWYDSRNSLQGLYQSCQDSNACTADTCQDNACKSQLKCDGSTCALNSADYMTYCQNNVLGQSTQNTSSGSVQTTQTTQSGQNQFQVKNVAISLLGKKTSDTSWIKNADVANNERMDFLMVVKNISTNPMSNVLVGSDLANGIEYTGNLQVDGVAVAGNIASGIDLGTLSANTSKSISFSAVVQSPINQSIQVVARATTAENADSDFFTININSNLAVASVSGSPFIQFIKTWYLWIIIILVLIILFVIIFRRLSTNP